MMDPDVDVRLPLMYLAGTLDLIHALQLYLVHIVPRMSVFDMLTLEVLTGNGGCLVKFESIHKNPDIETWYHLWEAVTALKDVCARAGKKGIAMGYGKMRCCTILQRFLLFVG